MNKLASLDMETAGLFDDAVVLSLGLSISDYDQKDITFKELVDGGLYLRFQIQEQIEMGRKTQASVMNWWKEKTTPEARKQAWGNGPEGPARVSIRELPGLLQGYLKGLGVDPKKVDWYDRNCFDMSKMQHIHEETLKLPTSQTWWDYQMRFEFATALRFLGSDRYGGMPPDSFPEATYHHPLHDAAMDHMRILNAIHSPSVSAAG